MKMLDAGYRKGFPVGVVLAFVVLVTSPAVMAAKTEPILGHVFAEDHVFNDVSERFIERLDELSGGSFDVQYHPGGSLGGWTQMVEQVSRGQIQMTMAWNHSELDRRWDIAALGFLADDWDAARALYAEDS